LQPPQQGAKKPIAPWLRFLAVGFFIVRKEKRMNGRIRQLFRFLEKAKGKDKVLLDLSFAEANRRPSLAGFLLYVIISDSKNTREYYFKKGSKGFIQIAPREHELLSKNTHVYGYEYTYKKAIEWKLNLYSASPNRLEGVSFDVEVTDTKARIIQGSVDLICMLQGAQKPYQGTYKAPVRTVKMVLDNKKRQKERQKSSKDVPSDKRKHIPVPRTFAPAGVHVSCSVVPAWFSGRGPRALEVLCDKNEIPEKDRSRYKKALGKFWYIANTSGCGLEQKDKMVKEYLEILGNGDCDPDFLHSIAELVFRLVEEKNRLL